MTNGLEKEYSVENPFNLHYINNEINEYNNISQFETTTTVSEETAVRTAFIVGNKDENSLTNKVFFDRHHELNKNVPLKTHQKELINEWLSIRNNIVRPIITELISKGKESPTYSGPQLNKLLGSLPEPMKLPPENPVEFAPEPVGIAHWPVRPVRTEDKDWHVVSYRFGPSKNDFVRGRNTAREFYAFRGVDRLHAAIDMYGNAGDQVVAIQDGIFLYAIVNFLGDTSAMYIQHTIDQPNLIFVYGEVEKNSWRTFNLKIGDKVKAGQVIAKLGITPGGSSMLHCETWGLGITSIKNRLHSSFRSWKKGGQPPKYVLNPTKYLLAVRKQELERRRKQQNSSTHMYKYTFNESLVPNETESFLGSVFSDVRGRLMWGKEYDTVSSAYRAGNTNENSLTNIIFFDRHTELNKNVPLKPHQKELIKEWLHIRDTIVRPIIIELKKTPSSTATPSSGKDDDCKDKWEREIKEFPHLVINAINGGWDKHWEDAVLLAIHSGIFDTRTLTRIVYFNNKQFIGKKYKFGYCDPKDTEAQRIYEISQKVVKELLTYPRPPLVKFDPYQCSKHDSKTNYNIIDNPLTKITGRYYSKDPYRVYIINQAGLHIECICSNVNRQRASYEIDRKHWSIHGDQLGDSTFLWFKRSSPTTYGKIRKKDNRVYMSVISSNEEPKGVEYELIKMEDRPSIMGSGAKVALPSSIDFHLFRQGELFPLTPLMKKTIETDLDKNFLDNIFEEHFIKGKNSQAKLIDRLKSVKKFSTQERPLVQIYARKILTERTWVFDNKMLKSQIDWIQHMLDQRGDTYEYREYLGLHANSNKSTGRHIYKFEFSLTGVAVFLGGGFGGKGTIEKITGNIKWKEEFYFSLFGISLTPPPFFDLSINKKYKGIARTDYEWVKENFSGFVELVYIEGSIGLGFASAEAGLMYVNGDRFFPPMTVFFQEAGFDFPNIDEIISILIDKKYIEKNKSFSWKDLVDVTFRDIAGTIRLPSSDIETTVLANYSKQWYPEIDFSLSNIKFLHFCRDADSLTDFGIQALRIISARELLMFRNKNTYLKIIGHADTLAKGKFVANTKIDYNLDLSQRRANTTLQCIKNILGDDFKILDGNIKKEGLGDRIADKDFGGRIVDSPKHRKVEILINSNIVLNLFG